MDTHPQHPPIYVGTVPVRLIPNEPLAEWINLAGAETDPPALVPLALPPGIKARHLRAGIGNAAFATQVAHNHAKLAFRLWAESRDTDPARFGGAAESIVRRALIIAKSEELIANQLSAILPPEKQREEDAEWVAGHIADIQQRRGAINDILDALAPPESMA